MSGFITVERSVWKHPIFKASEMSEREAWIWMISKAAWSDTKHAVGAEVHEVERGSFITTLREMQSAWMWGSDKRVRTFLRKLEKNGMLRVHTKGERNARKTHVTICNYDEYQSSGRTTDAAKTHDGRTTDAVKNKGTIKQEIDDDTQAGSPKELLERILKAAGIDWTKDISGKWFSSEAIHTVNQFRSLNLTDDEIVGVVREVYRRSRNVPGSLNYFMKPMQKEAGRKTEPPPQPIAPTAQVHNIGSYFDKMSEEDEKRIFG